MLRNKKRVTEKRTLDTLTYIEIIPVFKIFYLFIFLQKQDVKDNSIQKRLSWNYGQHIPNNELSLQQQSRLPVGGSTVAGGRNGTNKCLSNESMHSSSGVSSTGTINSRFKKDLKL